MIYANISPRNFGKKTENGLTYFLGASLYTIKRQGGENIEINSVEQLEALIAERDVDLIQFGIGGFPVHATPVEKARKHFQRFVRAACKRDKVEATGTNAEKAFIASGNKTTSSNGFVNYHFAARGEIERAKEKVFAEFPDAVIVNGAENWNSPDYKRPEDFARNFNIEPLAKFHTGISGATNTGIVLTKESFEAISEQYQTAFGIPITQHLTVWTEE